MSLDKNISVTIQCSRGYFPGVNLPENHLVEVSKGLTYGEVLIFAGIPLSDVGFISVNGLKKEKDDFVCENDNIRPMPLIICG